jgi:N-acyl-L-homoserine lactone synthetase
MNFFKIIWFALIALLIQSHSCFSGDCKIGAIENDNLDGSSTCTTSESNDIEDNFSYSSLETYFKEDSDENYKKSDDINCVFDESSACTTSENSYIECSYLKAYYKEYSDENYTELDDRQNVNLGIEKKTIKPLQTSASQISHSLLQQAIMNVSKQRKSEDKSRDIIWLHVPQQTEIFNPERLLNHISPFENSLHLITPKNYDDYRKILDEMYLSRYKIFCEKLKWDVKEIKNLATGQYYEKDEYDEKNAFYLVCIDKKGFLRGYLRLIEMKHECMFDGPFKSNLKSRSDYKDEFWEMSRLAKNHDYTEEYTPTESLYVLPTLLGALTYLSIHQYMKIKKIFLIVFPKIKKLLQQRGWSDIEDFSETEIQNNCTGLIEKILTITYNPSIKDYNLILKNHKCFRRGSLSIKSGKDEISFFYK